MAQVERYASKIPAQMRTIVRALDHEVRWAIVSILLEEIDLTYKELREKLQLEEDELRSHLNELEMAGLVAQTGGIYIEEDEYGKTVVTPGPPDERCVSLTPLGVLVIGDLYKPFKSPEG